MKETLIVAQRLKQHQKNTKALITNAISAVVMKEEEEKKKKQPVYAMEMCSHWPHFASLDLILYAEILELIIINLKKKGI